MLVPACFFGSAEPDSDPTGVDETIPGRLGINSSTIGTNLDPNGYRANIAGQTPLTLPIIGQLSFGDVAPGANSITIADIAPNCSIASIAGPGGQDLNVSNPLSVTVLTGRTDFYNYGFECVPNLGEIIVSNSTDGDPGVRAYTVAVNGETRPFPPGFNVFFDVPAGDHIVVVSEVPANCFLIGDNPANVSVEFQGSVGVSYRIDCTGERGTLRVITNTSGSSIDPDGYLVNVADQTIGFSNEAQFSHDFTLLPAGPIDVTVFDVADNCTLDPGSPFEATVVVNEVTEVIFDIDCAAAGEVDVSVTTTGASLDPDGYTITVDDVTFPSPINTTEPITFQNVVAGSVDVLLDGVAPNCTVAETNPQTVTVTEGEPTAVAFTVNCAATGSLQITTQTTGGAAPTDGFGLRIAGEFYTTGANETQTFDGIVAGDVEVRLDTEESPSCVVTAPNPRTVTVAPDQTATTTFQVDCPIPTPPVLFESRRSGNEFNIYAMNPNGSGVVRLTDVDGFNDVDPSWSWENDKIVFVSDRSGHWNVWVMDPDGSNPVQLTDTEAVNEDPAFSPDGQRIAYEEEDPDDKTLEIFIMDADGSNIDQLTDEPGISEAPQFHRNGQTILFKSNRSNNDFDVYMMDADGQNQIDLTSSSGDDFDPSYSPDMTTIIFSSQRDGKETLYLMDADGKNERRFPLPAQFYDWHPVYSTDGTQVIFTTDRDGGNDDDTDDYELYIVNVDGTGLSRLTNNARTDDDAEFKKPIM